ncbi:MAG: hypothetical protein Q8L78_04340 [Coxiellaceae bacterium]|nr:hypothetical protein [Coxiellaceae bacterium]
MYIQKIAAFLEAHKNKTPEALKQLLEVFARDVSISETDKKLYAYLGRFLTPFFEFRNNSEIYDKALFEQMALFYESDAIKKPINAAVCWTLFFRQYLDKRPNPLRYVVLAENFFYEPNRFFGFLSYLLSQGVSPEAILETHIIHRFFQYNCDFTNEEDAVIRQFLRLFDAIKYESAKLLLENLVKTEIMIRKNFAFGFSQDAQKKWIFKMLPSRTAQFDYALPPFHCQESEELVALYNCFQMDVIRKLDFSKNSICVVLASFFEKMLDAGHYSLNELFHFVLHEMPFEQTKSVLSKLFDLVNSAMGEEKKFSEILEKNPNFIFAMFLGVANHKDFLIDAQTYLAAPNFCEFFSENNIKIGLVETQILIKFLAASDGDNSDVFSVLFDAIKRIVLENKNKGESDHARYGIPLSLLEEITQLPSILKRVESYLEEINAPVFQKIKEGAHFFAICEAWQLPLINVFKSIFPALFTSAHSLHSTNALKVIILKNEWDRALESAEHSSTSAETLFSFKRVFSRLSPMNGQMTLESKVRILSDALIDISDKRLMILCINCLGSMLNFSQWVEKIAFVFDRMPKSSVYQPDLISAVLEKQRAVFPGFFGSYPLFSHWKDKSCGPFYIACALEMIRKEYQGSRKDAVQNLCVYSDAWLEKVTVFLKESRRTQQISRLNRALIELVAQAKKEKPVSMQVIFKQLESVAPAPGADDVSVFVL